MDTSNKEKRSPTTAKLCALVVELLIKQAHLYLRTKTNTLSYIVLINRTDDDNNGNTVLSMLENKLIVVYHTFSVAYTYVLFLVI